MSADDPRLRAEQRTLLMPRREPVGTLPVGHRLQEFVIEKVLEVGRCSVVYLAQDTRLERRVALKEYMPATLAQRLPDGRLLPRLPRFAELYEQGLQGFVNAARLLGAFDHPALVKVYRCWPEHGTACMVMPYYEGITLKRWLAELGAPPSERWLRKLAGLLMDALGTMHAQRCFHRDVAPDNILMLFDRKAIAAGGNYLEQNPKPVLLDFGAARRVIGEGTQNLTAVLKSGYSPIEQYEGDSHLRQGAWTDVYALCAVLYAAAFGHAPPSAIARAVRDDIVPAREAGRGRYTDTFLAAIDAGLCVRPEQRPRDMAALRALLTVAAETAPLAALPAAAGAPRAPGAPGAPGAARRRAARRDEAAPRRRGPLAALVGAGLAAALVAGAWLWFD